MQAAGGIIAAIVCFATSYLAHLVLPVRSINLESGTVPLLESTPATDTASSPTPERPVAN
jgi:hypothetical protein